MNESFQNPSEEFVFNFCRHSFLSLWSYANPLRSNGKKELCDILVVCEPHVIIFSIKYIQLKNKSEPQTEAKRWWKKAIDNSIKQIYGAENNLSKATHVIRSDGEMGLPIPPINERIIHRISISLGAAGSIPTYSADFGKGFVHVLDENSFREVLTELDTILDFTDYLEKKRLIEQYPNIILEGGEKSLLSLYIFGGKNFPEGPPPPIIDGSNWEELQRNEQYQEEKKAFKRSYIWDEFIEHISEFVLKGEMEFKENSLSDDETVLRYLARENRYCRLLLSDRFKGFLIGATEKKIKARRLLSPSEIGYVFLNSPPEYEREDRIAELGLRCFVARNDLKCSTIIGIGINVERAEKGFATDMYLLSVETWTDEDVKRAEKIKEKFGFFKGSK